MKAYFEKYHPDWIKPELAKVKVVAPVPKAPESDIPAAAEGEE
ncbi:MAG: hypothetical protein ABL958_21650 [Bdellovibrionia bacterium]